MKKLLIIFMCVALCLAFLSACNSSPTKNAEQLRTSAKAYGKLIRWKAYEDAAKYLKPRDEQEIMLDLELLNEIRVTKYELASMVLSDAGDEATVLAEISYYHERVNNVRDIRDQQLWWKDKDTGAWYLDGQLPPFIR